MRRFLLLVLPALVLSLNLPASLYAQSKDVVFEHLTAKDGLPEPSVMAMLQDTLGFLWLGTQNGLVKYDGIDMTSYRHDADDPHSIGGRIIRTLLEDRNGDLWVGTAENGVSHFDRAMERFTTYRHDPDDPHTLSHNYVHFIHEDRAGQIWLLTGGGNSYLNRLDPATGTVTRYRHDADDPGSLSHDVVTAHLVSGKIFHAFHEDRQGDLWVGTQDGLNRYDRATDSFTHFKHDPDDPKSLSHDRVASIFEDRAGRLWVGTLGGGLNLMDRATGTFTAYRHDPRDANSLSHDIAAVFFEDRAGRLWVTTAGGLDRFDPETGQISHYPYEAAAPTMPRYNVFVPIAEEDDGHLWMLAAVSDSEDLSRDPAMQEGKSFQLNPATGVFTEYPDDPNDPASFKGRLVTSYLTDRSGVFWLGSWIGGLNKVVATRFTQVAHDPDAASSLSTNVVSAVYEAPSEPGVLWIGTQAGLDRLDRATGRFTHFQPPNPWTEGPNVVFAIQEDRAGRLWLGTRLSGLLLMDRQTGRFTQFTRNPDDHDDPTQLGGRWVHAILEDRAGLLWFGTEGLDRYDPDTGTFTHFRHDPMDSTSLSHDGVTVLYEDRAGTLWVGSDQGGVSRFNPETETFTTYRDARNGPISVHALYEDETGRFWVGDGLTGLHLLDRETGTTRKYTVEDGLPGNAVFGIVEDTQGRLWINTMNGLARFDPEAESFGTFAVPGAGCAFKNTGGEVFLCSREGFFSFHPDQIPYNSHPPQVALTGLRLFNEPVGVGPDSLLTQHASVAEQVTLAHNQNDLTFEYAALHFVNPEQNTYRYKLDNYEDGWRDAGTRRATIYPNLPPGAYTFRVTAANSDGVWNEQGAALHVTIHPPWWRTTGAYVLYGLLLLAGLIAVDRTQRRRLIRKERQRAEIEQAEVQMRAAKSVAELASAQAREAEAEKRALQAENERKESELEKARELEQAYHELDETHQHLKATQTQLIQAEKMASLGQLTAGVAHEIKNPLNFINNLSELSVEMAGELAEHLDMLKNRLDAPTRTEIEELLGYIQVNAQKISEQGRQADGIVRSMLEHSRSAPGARASTDVNALVEEYVNLAYHGTCARYAGFNASINRDYDDDAGRIEMTPQEMGRVFINLLNNAFDAVREKQRTEGDSFVPTVSVVTRHRGDHVEIRVNDNGSGIPEALRAKIFEPFFTTKPPGAGTGLGLSLSYDIVVQGHGGTLTAESETGEGTTFVITLPTR